MVQSSASAMIFALFPFIFFWVVFVSVSKKLRPRRKTILIITSVVLVFVFLPGSIPRRHFPSWVVDLSSAAALIVSTLITVKLTRWLMGYNKWTALSLAPIFLFLILSILTQIGGFVSGESGAVGNMFLSAIFLSLIWFALNRNGTFRGWYGEQQVARRLMMLTKKYPGQYRVLNGVLLQNEKRSSEIDHVVMSRYGIFVIETKAYRYVRITDDGDWFAGIGSAQSLGDPCSQNIGHIKALKSVLGAAPFFSLVVLTRAKVSGTLPKGVVALGSVVQAILAHTEQITEEAEVEKMFERLKQVNADSPEARKEHIRRAQSKDVAAQRIL